MYTDPSLIRTHVVKLSFNDREEDLINAWVAYTGQQKAALIRDMVLEQARLELDAAVGGSERPQSELFGNR